MSDPDFRLHNALQQILVLQLKIDEMRPVYDAAMEVLRTWDEEGKGYPPEEKLKLVAVATDEMLAVCRQAKRGT